MQINSIKPFLNINFKNTNKKNGVIKKEQSAEFVFLLSLPVILGGALVEGYKAFKEPVVTVEILPLVLGVVFAYVVGVICLKFLIGLIKNKSLKPFAFYLLLPFLLSLVLL